MRLSGLLVAILLLMAMPQCAPKAAENPSTVVVSGRVLDSATAHPIVGAVIAVKEAGVLTFADTTGAFRLQLPRPAGKLMYVEVRAIGYAPRSVDVTITRDSTQNVGQIVLLANPVQLDDLIVTKLRDTATRQVRPQRAAPARRP